MALEICAEVGECVSKVDKKGSTFLEMNLVVDEGGVNDVNFH